MGSGASTQVQSVEDEKRKTPDEQEKTKATVAAKKNKKLSRTNLESATPQRAKTTPVTPVLAVDSKDVQSDSVTSVSILSEDQSGALARLQTRVKQLEKELGESESDKLDLQDRIQALEERLSELTTATAAGAGAGVHGFGDQQPQGLHETLKAKDHYIQQLEKQLATTQGDANKTRIRLKKKIKTLTTQLNEARQESSIVQLEMRERNQDKPDNGGKGHQTSHSTPSPGGDDEEGGGSKMKVILDLSAQVSEQAEKIAQLEKTLEERDTEIRELMDDYTHASSKDFSANSHRTLRSLKTGAEKPHTLAKSKGPSESIVFGVEASNRQLTPVDSADWFTSDRSRQMTLGSMSNSRSVDRPPAPSANKKGQGRLLPTELALERQSTALSDSDSDWEMDPSSTKIHSAPARTRVKSAASGSGAKDTSKQQRTAEEDKWSIATDDNDLLLSVEATASKYTSHKQTRKSALKTKLERTRNERSKGLIGPSLAFASPAIPPQDQITDTSCNNTPTPRSATGGFEFSTGKGMSFAV